jgi:uncharacterized protein (TIRG00374 family)
LLPLAALSATVVVPLVLGGTAPLLAALHFPAQGYIAIFIPLVASWLCRTLKLSLLLQRLNLRPGFARVMEISVATDFAFVATPAGVGGYATSLYYLRRAGASTGGATALVAADQGIDALFFIVALPLAGLCLIGSAIPGGLSQFAFVASALIATLAAVALLARQKLAQWVFTANALSRRWPRLLPVQLALREFFAKLRTNGRPLLMAGPLFLLGIFVLSALQQLMRYSIFWLALLLLGHRVSFALTFLLQTFVLQAASWTGLPSGGGAAEIGFSAALGSWVPNAELATALLLWRVATLYVCLIAGAIAIALLARRSRPVIAQQGQFAHRQGKVEPIPFERPS